MNYESITTCDVCNGEDIGVVLWVSGCDVNCSGCHNKDTWNPESGKVFRKTELDTIINEL
jgi:anaerobic ribonucleoside-triphosphate reductase activating protein